MHIYKYIYIYIYIYIFSFCIGSAIPNSYVLIFYFPSCVTTVLLKPCSDEKQNGFKLLKTKTK